MSLEISKEKVPQRREQWLPSGNQRHLIEWIASRSNISHKEAARQLRVVLGGILQLTSTRKRLAIKKFGTFELRVTAKRDYKHPLTGENIPGGGKKKLFLRAADGVLDQDFSIDD